MAYKCIECGNIFEEGEQARWSEDRGEFWGMSCSEEMSGCPKCRGEYMKTAPCEICGLETINDELNSGVCDKCLQRYAYDAEMCYRIGKRDTEKVEINCFLASIFSPKEIDEILYREMKIIDKYALVNGNSFIDGNCDWFCEQLVEEVKNNENGKG